MKEFSMEHRKNLSLAATGRRHTAETIEKLSGPNNVTWKGDDVSYSALHTWLRNQLGTPRLCGHCGSTEAKAYDWASISKEYRRDLTDWIRLCRKCHIKYDGTIERRVNNQPRGDDHWKRRRKVCA
jgi:hypothetical protein